jgi:hypothetical protein
LRQLLRVPWGWSVWAARTPGGQLNLGRFTFCRVEESGITSPDDARKPTTIQFTHEAGGMLIVVCFDHPDLKDKWAYEGLSQVLEQERIGRLWPNPESAHPLPLLRATDVPLVGGLLYELIKATQEGE